MQWQLYKWICYAVGFVFITSGVVKLVSPHFIGMFAGLGLPFPEVTLYGVAILELSCGWLIASRMYLRLAVPPLIVIMISAILIAKLPTIGSSGILSFAFEARLDIVMLILLILIWKHGPKKN